VEIVDVEDAGDGGHGFADFSEAEVARGSFEEDVEGLADDADGTPDDHAGDEEGQERVDPSDAGEEDGRAAGDDSGGGEGVAEHVEEDAADVDVSGEAPEERGYGAVHEDTGCGDVHHEARLHGDGCGDAVDGLGGDPGGEDDESDGVEEGGEDSCALVAEGFLVGGGARLEIDGDEGEDDGEEIAYVVAGLGDEGEGVGSEAEEEGGRDVGEGEQHGELEHSLDLAVRARDHVHSSSVVGAEVGFNWQGGGGLARRERSRFLHSAVRIKRERLRSK